MWEAALRISTAIVTILAIAVLLATFHTIVTEANMPQPLSYALTIMKTSSSSDAIPITVEKLTLKNLHDEYYNKLIRCHYAQCTRL